LLLGGGRRERSTPRLCLLFAPGGDVLVPQAAEDTALCRLEDICSSRVFPVHTPGENTPLASPIAQVHPHPTCTKAPENSPISCQCPIQTTSETFKAPFQPAHPLGQQTSSPNLPAPKGRRCINVSGTTPIKSGCYSVFGRHQVLSSAPQIKDPYSGQAGDAGGVNPHHCKQNTLQSHLPPQMLIGCTSQFESAVRWSASMFSAWVGESWSPAQTSHRLLIPSCADADLLDGNHILRVQGSPTQPGRRLLHLAGEEAPSRSGADGEWQGRKAKAAPVFWQQAHERADAGMKSLQVSSHSLPRVEGWKPRQAQKVSGRCE